MFNEVSRLIIEGEKDETEDQKSVRDSDREKGKFLVKKSRIEDSSNFFSAFLKRTQNDGTLKLNLLSVGILILNTSDLVVSSAQERLDVSLVTDLSDLRSLLDDLLELLHQGIGDSHTRELFLTTVSTGGRVTSETSNQRQIKSETGLQPLDGTSRVVSQDTDQLRADKITGRTSSIIVEQFRGVLLRLKALRRESVLTESFRHMYMDFAIFKEVPIIHLERILPIFRTDLNRRVARERSVWRKSGFWKTQKSHEDQIQQQRRQIVRLHKETRVNNQIKEVLSHIIN